MCFSFSIPASLFRYVAGALSELASPFRWEQLGAVTPEDAAEFFAEFLFALESGECNGMEHRWVQVTLTSDVTTQHNTLKTIDWQGVNGSEGQFGFSLLTPSILYPPFPGKYVAFAQAIWATSTTGIRRLRILLDGTVVGASQWSASVAGVTSITTMALLNIFQADQEVQLQTFHNIGSDLDVIASLSTVGQTHMSIYRIF